MYGVQLALLLRSQRGPGSGVGQEDSERQGVMKAHFAMGVEFGSTKNRAPKGPERCSVGGLPFGKLPGHAETIRNKGAEVTVCKGESDRPDSRDLDGGLGIEVEVELHGAGATAAGDDQDL